MIQEVRENYFNWICNIVIKNDEQRQDYIILLSSLFNKEFTYIHPMDKNRYVDGIELRYKYASAAGYTNTFIDNVLGLFRCSVLEMMVALSLRCEEIMSNDDENRTYLWFDYMIESLELKNMTNHNFDDDEFIAKIDNFLNRCYSFNGRGSLFTLANPISYKDGERQDSTTTEIWFQMMQWLKEYVNRTEGRYINY